MSLCLLTGLLCAPIARADLRLPPLDPPVTGNTAPGDAALVIGIETYAFLEDVPYARRDAKALYDLMIRTIGIPAHAVIHPANQDASREILIDLVRDAVMRVDPDGTLWIYFAGHGTSDGDGNFLLVGVDATHRNLRARSIALKEIASIIREIRPDGVRTLFIIDACFSGVSRRNKPLAQNRPFVWSRIQPGQFPFTIWSAAQADQHAQPFNVAKHGLFTYFVVGAISGWADADRDERVRLDEAHTYVERQMELTLRGARSLQRPEIISSESVESWLLSSVVHADTAPSHEVLAQIQPHDIGGLDSLPRLSTTKPTLQSDEHDLHLLGVMSVAVEAQRDQDLSFEEKIEAWRAVADHAKANEEQRREAREHIDFWKRRLQFKSDYERDVEKVKQLLMLDPLVLSLVQKSAILDDFAEQYSQYRDFLPFADDLWTLRDLLAASEGADVEFSSALWPLINVDVSGVSGFAWLDDGTEAPSFGARASLRIHDRSRATAPYAGLMVSVERADMAILQHYHLVLGLTSVLPYRLQVFLQTSAGRTYVASDRSRGTCFQSTDWCFAVGAGAGVRYRLLPYLHAILAANWLHSQDFDTVDGQLGIGTGFW